MCIGDSLCTGVIHTGADDTFNLSYLVVHPLQDLHIRLTDAAVIIQALWTQNTV